MPASAYSDPAACEDWYERRRAELVAELEIEFAATAYVSGKPKLSWKVAGAMARIPRHEFVPEELRRFSYDNHPLPIGAGQTISQPYIVALMTDLLEPRPHHVILEVGTGSGYQAAVLARLVEHVYSIEVIADLANQAAATLARLDIANVSVRIGDGASGWFEHAPYDGIIVTAAASHVPPALVDQLKPKGRLVLPIGRSDQQELVLVTKAADGSLVKRTILPVTFVPLVGGGRQGSG